MSVRTRLRLFRGLGNGAAGATIDDWKALKGKVDPRRRAQRRQRKGPDEAP